MAKFKYGKLGYAQVLMLPLLLSLASEVVRRRLWEAPMEGIMGTILCSTLLICLTTLYFMCQSRPVYLIDFSCSKPDEKHKCPNALFLSCSHATGVFTEESLHFQAKICERSGLGDDTYLPPAVTDTSPYPCMAEARMEAEKIMFNALDSLFLKTDIKPKDIDFLIVNCSLFNPTPSLSSMIVNHYKMRPNIKSFNLGGMGCSTGVISIDLAKHLLQVHRNSYALVMSTENITLNWYWGNDRSMLLCNCIFRMGGAAILLSNKRRDKRRAKYEIVQSVRTHKGADDKSYRCVYQQEDAQKKVGVALSKELMAVAGDALKTNITTLGPLVLPISEQLLFFASLVLRKLLHVKIKPYIPDFKLAFEHFCIHAGGRAVLDEIEKNLHLGEQHMEPSRMTLYRFGNTSSSSLWYELAYTEAKGRIKRGDRIWQIAFGSGFKCNSAVWRALRCVEPLEVDNPWIDCIDKYPVNIPTVRAF